MDFYRCETTIHTSLKVREMWFSALLSEHLVFHVGWGVGLLRATLTAGFPSWQVLRHAQLPKSLSFLFMETKRRPPVLPLLGWLTKQISSGFETSCAVAKVTAYLGIQKDLVVSISWQYVSVCQEWVSVTLFSNSFFWRKMYYVIFFFKHIYLPVFAVRQVFGGIIKQLHFGRK